MTRTSLDWLFKDYSGRKGTYVIAEAPNLQLYVFMAGIILALLVYPGWLQKTLLVIAYSSLVWWAILEIRGGRSRFRKLLGYLGILSVIGSLMLHLGL